MLALSLTACSGGSAGDAPKGVVTSSPTPSASASPSPTANTHTLAGQTVPTYPGLTVRIPTGLSSTKQAVLLGYTRFWVAVLRAGASPQPLDRQLQSVTTGAAQLSFQRYSQQLLAKHQTQTGPVKLLRPTVTVAGAQATVRDCVDESRSRVRDASGSPINPRSTAKTPVTTTLVRTASSWRVSTYTEGSGNCSA